MLEFEAHVVCDLPGALDSGRQTGLREVDELSIMSEVLTRLLGMSVLAQPASDQPVEMAHEKVRQIERAGLSLTELRESLRSGEELITMSTGNPLDAFLGQYGVELAGCATFAVRYEEGPIAFAVGADLRTDRRCDAFGSIMELCRQAAHVNRLPSVYSTQRGDLASQGSACDHKNAATRIHLLRSGHPGGATGRQQALGRFYRDGGVTTVGVRANRFAELLVERRATDQNNEVLADTDVPLLVDHHFHVWHGGSEEGGHAEDVGLVLFESCQVFLDGIVDPQIDDFEAGALEHHGNEVLADIVDITFDRTDDDFADRLDTGLGEQRTQDLHAALHGVGGEKYLGHEQDAVSEVDADVAHAFVHRFKQHLFRAPAALELDPGGILDLGFQAVVQIIMHQHDELLIIQIAQIELGL